MATTPANRPKLLDQERRNLRTKLYSYPTEPSYVHWMYRFILFHDKRHPREMGGAEIERFLTELMVRGT